MIVTVPGLNRIQMRLKDIKTQQKKKKQRAVSGNIMDQPIPRSMETDPFLND